MRSVARRSSWSQCLHVDRTEPKPPWNGPRPSTLWWKSKQTQKMWSPNPMSSFFSLMQWVNNAKKYHDLCCYFMFWTHNLQGFNENARPTSQQYDFNKSTTWDLMCSGKKDFMHIDLILLKTHTGLSDPMFMEPHDAGGPTLFPEEYKDFLRRCLWLSWLYVFKLGQRASLCRVSIYHITRHNAIYIVCPEWDSYWQHKQILI